MRAAAATGIAASVRSCPVNAGHALADRRVLRHRLVGRRPRHRTARAKSAVGVSARCSIVSRRRQTSSYSPPRDPIRTISGFAQREFRPDFSRRLRLPDIADNESGQRRPQREQDRVDESSRKLSAAFRHHHARDFTERYATNADSRGRTTSPSPKRLGAVPDRMRASDGQNTGEPGRSKADDVSARAECGLVVVGLFRRRRRRRIGRSVGPPEGAASWERRGGPDICCWCCADALAVESGWVASFSLALSGALSSSWCA